MPKELPIVLSLVVCDHAYVDPVSDRISLLGLFSEIEPTRFPYRHPLFHVAAELTNGHGRVLVRTIVARTTGESLYGQEVTRREAAVHFAEPRATVSIGIDFTHTTFVQPGEHRVLIMVGAELLAER